jgi:hypothetical protein
MSYYEYRVRVRLIVYLKYCRYIYSTEKVYGDQFGSAGELHIGRQVVRRSGLTCLALKKATFIFGRSVCLRDDDLKFCFGLI